MQHELRVIPGSLTSLAILVHQFLIPSSPNARLISHPLLLAGWVFDRLLSAQPQFHPPQPHVLLIFLFWPTFGVP
jgi:hypothetical protein